MKIEKDQTTQLTQKLLTQGLATADQVRQAAGLSVHLATSTACVMCNHEIKVMVFKGTGVCSQRCHKRLIKMKEK